MPCRSQCGALPSHNHRWPKKKPYCCLQPRGTSYGWSYRDGWACQNYQQSRKNKTLQLLKKRSYLQKDASKQLFPCLDHVICARQDCGCQCIPRLCLDRQSQRKRKLCQLGRFTRYRGSSCIEALDCTISECSNKKSNEQSRSQLAHPRTHSRDSVKRMRLIEQVLLNNINARSIHKLKGPTKHWHCKLRLIWTGL